MLNSYLYSREATGSAIYADRQANLEPGVQERFIDLMCEYQPGNVHNYVKTADGYRLEETLEIVRKHQLSEATAFLLEKTGDVHGAFNIFLEVSTSEPVYTYIP